MRSRKNNGRHQGSPKKNKRSTKTQGSPKKNQREMSIGELTTKIQHIKLSKNRLLKKKQTLQADGTGKRKLEYNIPDLPPAKIMKLSESPSYIDSEDKQIVYDFLDAMMKGFEEPVKLFINSVMFMGFIKEYDTHLFEVSTNRLLMKNIEWINKYPTNDEKVKLMLIFNGVNQIMDYFIDSLKDSKSLISPADTLKIQLNEYFSDRMKDLFRLVRMTISFYNLLEEVKYTALIEDTLALYALQKHHNSRYIYDVIQDYDPDDDYIPVDDSLGKILKVINSADLEYTPMEDELLTFEESTFRSQRFLERDKEPHDTLLMSLLRSNLNYNGRNDFLIKCSILLINHKANVNAVNKETGETPLMIVCQAFSSMETELIELLLSNGADVNAVNKLGNGKTPLLYALSNSLHKNNFDAIDTLLSNGAKADVVDALGYNTLTISRLPLEVSRLLMDIKPDEKYPGRLPADINAKNNRNGETPLMHAVFNNDEDFINELLRRGANKNVTNNEGDTAYLIACRLSRYPDVVKQLYLPNKQINNKGQTPLMLICDNIIMNYNEKVDLIKYLLVKGAC